jgi:hypothetical protein
MAIVTGERSTVAGIANSRARIVDDVAGMAAAARPPRVDSAVVRGRDTASRLERLRLMDAAGARSRFRGPAERLALGAGAIP